MKMKNMKKMKNRSQDKCIPLWRNHTLELINDILSKAINAPLKDISNITLSLNEKSRLKAINLTLKVKTPSQIIVHTEDDFPLPITNLPLAALKKSHRLSKASKPSNPDLQSEAILPFNSIAPITILQALSALSEEVSIPTNPLSVGLSKPRSNLKFRPKVFSDGKGCRR